MPINARDRHVLALAVHVEPTASSRSTSATSRPRCVNRTGVEPVHPDELLPRPCDGASGLGPWFEAIADNP
jgi:hypothetical protein